MFIQVGNRGFNTEHITRCHRYGSGDIEVHTSDGGYVILKGDDALDFATWWDEEANDGDGAMLIGSTVEYWQAAPVDPMEPDYRSLANEKPMTASADSRDASGVGAT